MLMAAWSLYAGARNWSWWHPATASALALAVTLYGEYRLVAHYQTISPFILRVDDHATIILWSLAKSLALCFAAWWAGRFCRHLFKAP
jgi:hypothetical protein